MQAMQDLSVLANQEGDRILGACPPEKMTTLALIQLFGRYARAHPGELQGNAAVAVFRALGKAYPCHSAEATSQSCVCRKPRPFDLVTESLSLDPPPSSPARWLLKASRPSNSVRCGASAGALLCKAALPQRPRSPLGLPGSNSTLVTYTQPGHS